MKKIGNPLLALLMLASSANHAASFSVPANNNALIGNTQTIQLGANDSVTKLAQKYNIGFNALQNANPQYDFRSSMQIGAPVVISTKHLLPGESKKGIVVNLPEMRLYYYPNNSNRVLTYPIGIGKIGKTIPIKRAIVTRKKKDPSWIPPQDIREFNLEQGIVLPRIMPAGPDNPLGQYAIYMTIPTYLIHSTIYPESVGMRASFGCIRMYETDIADFFPLVEVNTPITIINQPIKVAWQDNDVYLEAHPPLQEHNQAYNANLPGMVSEISKMTSNEPVLIDWQLVSYLASERDGIPHKVGVKLK